MLSKRIGSQAKPRPSLLGLVLLALATVAPLGAARAADNIFLDLVVGMTGFLVGDADDRFLVSRDFLNSSTQATSWSTTTAELVFRGGPAHVFTLTGVDRGRSEQGYDENFAWGTLRLEPGQTLVLQDGNAAPGGAQYVRRLLLEDGVSQTASVTGNGLTIYYDPAEPDNAYLAGQTYPLAGGGAIEPVSPPVPALPLGGQALLALALGATAAGSIRAARFRSARRLPVS